MSKSSSYRIFTRFNIAIIAIILLLIAAITLHNIKKNFEIDSNGVFIPINILDRLRVFSLCFSLVIGLILLYINGRFTVFNKELNSIFSRYMIINLTIWLMLTLLFISNPGRYPLPYLLLSYIYLITALDKNIKNKMIY